MISIDAINALLPQTQCGQCSYKGCKPYAAAIAVGEADINQCPPGGEAGIAELATLLGVAPKPLNPTYGVHKPKQVAVILEDICIGCVKCIAACPVDAIVGAAKQMHTVIADECTGCELCIAPCPVDCIELQPLTIELSTVEKKAKAQRAKQRYEHRLQRLERLAAIKQARLAKQKAALAQLKVTTAKSNPHHPDAS